MLVIRLRFAANVKANLSGLPRPLSTFSQKPSESFIQLRDFSSAAAQVDLMIMMMKSAGFEI